MLDRARKRSGANADRVHFIQTDLLSAELPIRHYDAVITCFLLDCFTETDARFAVKKIATSLRLPAKWLWADFVLPPCGLARWRAQVWLTVRYTFFRWQTGRRTRELPPSEVLITSIGFTCVVKSTFQWGLVRNAVFS